MVTRVVSIELIIILTISAKPYKYRSSDKQTMRVGITENNIFSDNNNFIFSQGRVSGASCQRTFLSYMQAHILHEEYA